MNERRVNSLQLECQRVAGELSPWTNNTRNYLQLVREGYRNQLERQRAQELKPSSNHLYFFFNRITSFVSSLRRRWSFGF